MDTLKRLLHAHPGLATARIDDGSASRTLLHVATGWHGHFPNGEQTLAALIDAGAEVNAPLVGPHAETPLHWAASSDDVGVLDRLIAAGAEIEARGAVIGGGTPLADAVAFGQWRAARRLLERGARTKLWQAVALGLMGRVEDYFSGDAPPASEEITKAFWLACHGGQRETAEYLLDHGAELDWIGYDGLTALDAARREGTDEVISWLRSRGARSAGEYGYA